MKIAQSIAKKDLEYINCVNFILWNRIREKTFFITGATGLVGYNIINALLYCNEKRKLNIKIVALVRDIEKAQKRFINHLNNKNLLFVEGDIRNFSFPACDIDYIIHGASITSSKEFINNPTEVYETSLNGTYNLLKLAKQKRIESFVYLSSMEVYGNQKENHICKEEDIYFFDSNDPRNSYPIAKQKCEEACLKYFINENIPVKIARLSQVFGPGINENDNRIWAEVARCVEKKKNIVLHTSGESKRCYIYTADVVTGILTILLSGKNGSIYNVANPETYCSIKDFANYIANNIATKEIKVEYDYNSVGKGYQEKTFYLLDINKLLTLGWKYKNGLGSYINVFEVENNE